MAWMIMLATIVFGLVAVSRIGVSQMPDVDFATISVNATLDGATPEVMENDVVAVLEDALSQIEGARYVNSSARLGSATITIELDLTRDVDLAMLDVQMKVAQVQRQLPRDLDPPIVSKSNPEDEPIVWVDVSGPFPRSTLADYARYRIKDRLQTVPGVGEIQLGGYAERNVRIWLDAERLNEHGLAVQDVLDAVGREHAELPGGRIETDSREIEVRVLGEAMSLTALRELIVKRDGVAIVRLQDVGLVQDGFADIRSVSRVDGQISHGLGIKKQRGANTVEVARAVRQMLQGLRKELPAGMRADLTFDASEFIEKSINDIQHELVLAILLTGLVCWAFLGSVSSTVNVLLAIPMSLLGTVAVIYFLRFTLNTFTLLALALAIGIVVDDAIMVLENIHRHLERGKTPMQAAQEGTNEIKLAALSATVAIGAIFVPIIFVSGMVGKFLYQFGITLSCAVAFSYVESVTLAPARCARLLKRSQDSQRSGLTLYVERRFATLESFYGRVLARALARPGGVLLGALAVFGVSLWVLRSLPMELSPTQDQSRLIVRIQTGLGSSLEETERVMQPAEQFVAARPEVQRATSIVGGFGGVANTGVLMLTLTDPANRALSQTDFATLIRKELNALPGIAAVVQDPSQQNFSAQRVFPIEFSLRGPDWLKLVEASRLARDELGRTGTVVDIDTDYKLGQPELRIALDRDRAADVGVSAEEIATAVNALVGGKRVARYSADGRRVDVRVRLLRNQRQNSANIGDIRVRAESGELVPLDGLVKMLEGPARRSITHRERERAITITGNVAPASSQDRALAAVEALGADLPNGVRLVLGGGSVVYRDAIQSFLFALLLGVVVAYMVLAAQFDSFSHPITVLVILPLSLAGALFALRLVGKSLNMYSVLGILLLMGIAKKNSIILVDYANQLRRNDLRVTSATQAMERAAPLRLKAILMTSLATLIAAIPPALGLGHGSETRVPMAVVVLGGMSLSTLLSLFVVPAFYVELEQVGAWFRGVWSGSSSGTPRPRLTRRT